MVHAPGTRMSGNPRNSPARFHFVTFDIEASCGRFMLYVGRLHEMCVTHLWHVVKTEL